MVSRPILVVGFVSAAAGAVLLLLTATGGKASQADPDDEGRRLFLEVEPSTVDMNEQQAKVLERIQKSPATVGKPSIVRLQEDALKDESPARLTAKTAGLDLVIRSYKLYDHKDSAELAWPQPSAGQDYIPEQFVALTKRAESVTGLMFTGGKLYSVEPLGRGLSAVVQIDQSKFHKDHPPGFEAVEKTKNIQADLGKAPPKGAQPIVFRVLVAYTPQVDGVQGDIVSLINSAVDLSNRSYRQSNVALRMELAHIHKVDYTESSTHENDLKLFMGKDDKIMDEIHGLRARHGAHICVLLINNDQYCGLAADIGAKHSTAFAVVHHDCAVKNLSFLHEVGHLLGARHNPEVDNTESPPAIAYGHGFLNPKGTWRTVMAYATTENPIRLPWWSNPDVSYQGVPMGTAAIHNNARVLNEMAKTVNRLNKP